MASPIEKSIPKTLVGTNNIPTMTHGVPIIEGFHFPADWSTRFAATFWDTSGKFNISILEGKVASRAALNIEAGLAGPNWAGRMEVEGSASEETVRLDVLMDDFKAGMLIGLNINPQFALQVQAYTWVEHHQYWPPKLWFTKSWRNLVNIEQDSNFQLIPFCFMFGKLVEQYGKDLAALIPLVQDFLMFLPSADANMIDSASGITDYVSDTGDFLDWIWKGLTMSPDIQMEWDLIEIAIAVGETAALIPPVTAAGETLTLIEKVTKWLRPEVGSGPVLGVVINVHLKISGLTGYSSGTTPGTITTSNIRTEGSVIVADVASGAEHIPNLDRLGVNFTHRAGISFEFGWHSKISWLKILSHDFVKLYQPSALGLEIPISEQYKYELSNNIGSTNDSGIKITLVDKWVFYEG